MDITAYGKPEIEGSIDYVSLSLGSDEITIIDCTPSQLLSASLESLRVHLVSKDKTADETDSAILEVVQEHLEYEFDDCRKYIADLEAQIIRLKSDINMMENVYALWRWTSGLW